MIQELRRHSATVSFLVDATIIALARVRGILGLGMFSDALCSLAIDLMRLLNALLQG
jgi:hypothetical protein